MSFTRATLLIPVSFSVFSWEKVRKYVTLGLSEQHLRVNDGKTDGWNIYRVQWIIAGLSSVCTVISTIILVFRHARNYTSPLEQRQILRIVYLPSVFCIVSLLCFEDYAGDAYYSLIQAIYEAIALSAFMLLFVEMFAATTVTKNIHHALASKEKRHLPFPLLWLRYRPTKAYFMHAIRWSVLQFVIIRPLSSIIGMICEAYNVYCKSEGMDVHYANAYIKVIGIISTIVAVYGLSVFYFLTAKELQGRRLLAKFACVKLLIAVPMIQSFIFSILENHGTISATEYRTKAEIVSSLNALCICVESLPLALFMFWTYSPAEYAVEGRKTGILRPLWDSVNISDFAVEIYRSLRFFVDYARGRSSAHGHGHLLEQFDRAFDLAPQPDAAEVRGGA